MATCFLNFVRVWQAQVEIFFHFFRFFSSCGCRKSLNVFHFFLELRQRQREQNANLRQFQQFRRDELPSQVRRKWAFCSSCGCRNSKKNKIKKKFSRGLVVTLWRAAAPSPPRAQLNLLGSVLIWFFSSKSVL